jgi:hypothetical protein
VARLDARTGGPLDAAEALALRALALERRVFHSGSLDTGDTVAWIALAQGRPYRAARVMEEVLPRARPYPHLGGRFHLRLAQAQASLGDLDDAATTLLEALTREIGLVKEAAGDPWLAPLAADGRLEAILDEARDRVERPNVE